MKTLDEVIAELEDERLFADALYFLKMYRSDMQMYAENQKYWETELMQKIKDFGDAKERYIAKLKELDIGTLNDPLSWEQLKQMEGKPVWIEFLNDEGNWNGEWCLVESSNDMLCEILRCKMTWWASRKITLGKTWQAYRKERE